MNGLKEMLGSTWIRTRRFVRRQLVNEELDFITSEVDDNEELSQREVYEQKQIAWQEIEDLVMIYKKRFDDEKVDDEVIAASERAGEELIARFENLFHKYSSLVRTGNFNWRDRTSKKFVRLFIDDQQLKSALSRTKSNNQFRRKIHDKFNFVVDTYGALDEEYILSDLHTVFCDLMKRYEPMGRTFCGYINNAFRFYLYRHITSYIKEPMSVKSNVIEFKSEIVDDETLHEYNREGVITKEEDDTFEHNLGIPDERWITGEECGEAFQGLTPIQRKIIVKYYLENWNDRQISDAYCMHINAVNQLRRRAIRTIAESQGINLEWIRRVRNSGAKARLPK